MIDKITKAKFRQLLDEVGYRTAIDSDGDFYTILDADDDFDHDVNVFYIVNEENHTVSVLAGAADFEVRDSDKANALLKCNQWNMGHLLGTAYLKGNVIEYRTGFFLDEPVSEIYIKANVIKESTGNAWRFFCSLKK